MIRRRLGSQRGSALVAAIFVMSTIFALGLAMLAAVDAQTRLSGHERGRESTFNWVEAVLNAETFTVASHWPAASNGAIMDCAWTGGSPSASNGTVNACPDPGVISNTFSGNVDVGRGARWSTAVRDNTGNLPCEDTVASNCSYAWNEGTSLAAAHWDSNADNLVWLRADASVNGDRRVVVALVRIQNDPITLPQAAIVAGSLNVQGGNKEFIHENGSSIAVRCAPLTDSNCYSEQFPGINVKGPGTKQSGYADDGHVMTDDDLDSMRTRAKNDNRYFPPGQCPTSAAAMSGPVVFIEDADCIINANWQINAPPAPPGLLIVARGTLRFNGNMDFWGLVYMANGQNWGPGDGLLFDGNGNGNLHGSLFVDGNGSVKDTGSFTLDYDPNAVNAITAYGTSGIVPNSFREINP